MTSRRQKPSPPARKRAHLLATALLFLCPGPLVSSDVGAFSQSSPITPIGHEWLTASSALDLIGEKPDMTELAQETGAEVTGTAPAPTEKKLLDTLKEYQEKGPTLTPEQKKLLIDATGDWSKTAARYGSRHYSIWSAVMGQRWVDLGGFRITGPKGKACWDAITQAQPHVQYSHFLRTPEDTGPGGALRTIRGAQGRLRLSFIAAATAADGPIKFWDGGAASVKLTASRPYFLFGRAVHLFQDSFSPEHGMRDVNDGFRTITGVKSYVCTAESAQHVHDLPLNASHGDVIWRSRLSTDWSDGNLKPEARAARRAMKDLWAAFLTARAAPDKDRVKVAKDAIESVIAQWFSYSESTIQKNEGGAGQPKDQKACLAAISYATKEAERKACLKTIGALDPKDLTNLKIEMDEDLQMPFEWKNIPAE